MLSLDPSQEVKGHSELDERTDDTFEAIKVVDGMVKKPRRRLTVHERGER